MSPGLAALFWMAVTAFSVILLTERKGFHPIILLAAGALACGLGSGMSLLKTIQEMESGFGMVLSSLGLPVLAFFCAEAAMRNRREMSAFKAEADAGGPAGYVAAGFLAGACMPRESAFLLLKPSTPSDTRISHALAMGIMASSAFCLPGVLPLAAAQAFGAPLPRFFLLSLAPMAAALAAALVIRSFVFREKVGAIRLPRIPSLTFLPAGLMIAGAMAGLPSQPLGSGAMGRFVMAVGQPSAAWGIFLAATLSAAGRRVGFERVGEWIGEGARAAGPQLVLVGMSGALARVLHSGPFFFFSLTALDGLGLGILLPFALAVCARMATGSPLAAVVLASAAAAPLTGGADPAIWALAVCAGSLFFIHGNDSFFWIFSSSTETGAKGAYRMLGLGAAAQGLAAFAAILVLSFSVG